MCLNNPIKKCSKELAALYSKKHKIEDVDEDIKAVPGNELDSIINEIDAYIEGEYSRIVFEKYSAKKPILIREHTGETVNWDDAFGNSFDKTTPGQRHSLVGLIEGGGQYGFK